jgi:hypothetical protein
MKAKKIIFSSFLLLAFSTPSFAITTDQGGHDDKFTGGGDRVPPQCQLDLPSSASSAFVVKWSCFDNFADKTPQSSIRTSLWIRRANDTRWLKLDDFLGFPASVLVDEGILQITPTASFDTGLPVSFRLEATDTAGITTISKTRTVLGSDDTLNSCDLVLTTDSTESTGGTTGLPAMNVTASNATVSTTQSLLTSLSISTPAQVIAAPCEVDDVCSNNSLILLDATVGLDEDNGTASGTLAITPGISSFEVSGTYQQTAAGQVINLSLTGTTEVNGATANVSLSCEND